MVQGIKCLAFVALLAILRLSASQQSGGRDVCYEGFVTRLPDTSAYDQFSTLYPTSTNRTYLYPQLRFNCDGVVDSVTIPWQTQETDDLQNPSVWRSTVTIYLSIWRQENEKSVLQQQHEIQTTLLPATSRSGSSVTSPELINFSTRGIMAISPMLTVHEKDFIGLTLPGFDSDEDENTIYNHLPVLRPRTWVFTNCSNSGNSGVISNCLMQLATNPVMQISFSPLRANITENNNSVARSLSGDSGSIQIVAALGTLTGLLLLLVAVMAVVIGILLFRTWQCRRKKECKSKKDNGDNSYRTKAQQRDNPNTLTPMLTSQVHLRYETVETLPAHTASEANMTSRDDIDTTYEQPETPSEIVLENGNLNTSEDAASNGDYEYTGVFYVPGSKERQRSLGSDQVVIKDEELYVYADPNCDRTPTTENNDSLYWEPGHTASDIYDQMSSKRFIEVPTSAIQKFKLIGAGEFGQVYNGKWHLSTGKTTEVALKMLKPSATSNDKVKLLQEAAFVGQFRHPHIVQLYGVQTLVEPVTIILELLPKGDLRQYLVQLQTRMNTPDWSETDDLQPTAKSLLQFCQEIADGMRYLSRKGFIHRDLAARNILLTDNCHCKIGDFGLCKDLSEDTYYITNGGRIPLKWTAPEAILYRKYSTKSDVWSYGMVMYEIWSLGRKPFDEWEIQKVIEILEKDFYLPSPSGCPQNIYQLMVSCWNRKTDLRPTFDDLYTSLNALPGSDADSNYMHSMQQKSDSTRVQKAVSDVNVHRSCKTQAKV